ncbi:MAG: hypothetical protein AAF657_26940 [Acidobacteriota bacterium]
MPRRETGFFDALIDDGRPLLSVTGLALVFSGCFALFVSAHQQFLPHDVQFLGASAAQLSAIAEGRVAYFMFHDRVAFGGAILAVGLLYLWLAALPLAQGERWAWWAFAGSGLLGFGSFLTYLGYGYLDSWHGTATLALLPLFLLGLWRSHTLVRDSAWPRRTLDSWGRRARLGRVLLLFTGVGMILAGGTIMFLGITAVFVPQDLAYMGVTPEDLTAFNPRLVPLIAHDRAGFGGGVASCGVLVLFCVWFAQPSRSLWQVLTLSGVFGFGTAIGVHFVIGYTDWFHLAPAFAGLAIYLAGLAMSIVGRSE